MLFYILDKKLLSLIFAVFDFFNCFLLHFIKSVSFNNCSCLSLFKQSHNHSGYSSSSKATGSFPLFFIFKFNTVPGAHEEGFLAVFIAILATENALVGIILRLHMLLWMSGLSVSLKIFRISRCVVRRS